MTRAWMAVLAAGVVGCSSDFLEPRQADATNIDNRITIGGQVCTDRPDPTGFPVKVVLVVDQSGSMCVSDPPGSQESTGFCEAAASVLAASGYQATEPGRVRALRRLLTQFQGIPNVQVALVPFETNVKGTWPTAVGQGGARFARPDGNLLTRVQTLQAELGKGTDYQGALAYAYSVVASDITATAAASPEVLPRTRYVVVFLTDGTPFPRCAGNDNLTRYADDLNPELTWEDSFGAGDFCNQIDPDDPDAITGFVAGTDRNQNYQLFSYVQQLMDLKDQYNIGDVRLHTVLLFNEEAVRACGPICQDLYGRYVRWPGPVPVADGPASAKRIATWTLQQLATRGNGVYQEFNDFAGVGQLNLGSLDYSSLASKNVLKSLILQPLSSEPGELERVIDTDGEGLVDELDNDFTHRTSRFAQDSDADGFDDAFEVRRFDEGFRADAKDGRGCNPASPLTRNCTVRDTDGDGLSEYAETYLRTRPTLVDSDGDGVPDGLEVKYGLDPLARSAAGLDTDGDDVPDAEEFRIGSNPIRRDKPYQDRNAFQYEITARPQADDSICYDFQISNVQMVTPPEQAGQRQGFNLFKVWFGEAPESGVGTDYGRWKVACAWTQYAPPSVRVPAGPETPPMANRDFRVPFDLDERAEYDSRCLGINPSRGQTPPSP